MFLRHAQFFTPKLCRGAHNLRSEIFMFTPEIQPINANSKPSSNKSISSVIMESNGFVTDNGSGLLINLPLGKRVQDKLANLLREEMNKIRGQEIEMPAISDLKLWKTTERDDLMGSELFRLKDRHGKELCLCPTHEEIVTNLVSKYSKAISASCLGRDKSLRLYQITRKYRDESRPKHTLLRAREFLMKDMYSFHASEACASQTYDDVSMAYEAFLNRLDLRFVKAEASVGAMGGQRSHEYLIESNVGEDRILECNKCGKCFSSDLVDGLDDLCTVGKCGQVGGSCEKPMRCIEVGHTFLLGDRYTKYFPINIKNTPKDSQVPIQMGCYGIGLSRLMQACIEQRNISGMLPDWPIEIAPFQVAIIPAKDGSKLEEKSKRLVPYLYEMLNKNVEFKNDVLIDDRTSLTIGRRCQDAKVLGVPILVVLGKSIEDEEVEIVVNSESMRKDLDIEKLYCHSRETAHFLKQLKNDYFYKLKTKNLFK